MVIQLKLASYLTSCFTLDNRIRRRIAAHIFFVGVIDRVMLSKIFSDFLVADKFIRHQRRGFLNDVVDLHEGGDSVKHLFSKAMFTDHSYYGNPIEVSRVDVSISDDVIWTPEMLAELGHQAEERLHAMVNRMPHRYWKERRKDKPPCQPPTPTS